MEKERLHAGSEVYVNCLRPCFHSFVGVTELAALGYKFTSSCRVEGQEGFVISNHTGWLDGTFIVRHNDGTFGVYFYDELEPGPMIYWYKVQKMFGYR